jgi:putative ABC transport system permease protein
VGDVAQTVGLAVSPFGTLDSLLVRSRVMAEFLARSASGFSALCLLVALGGMTTHFLRWVRWRRRDLGIRLCLGATAAQARAEVFRAARVPLAGGVLAGVTLAALAAGTMVSLMPELPDGRTESIVTAALLVTVLALATLVLPATVAGRADPLEVLRRD